MAKTKEVKLTPEILEKLRGFSVVSKTVDHKVEIADVPPEFWPVFKLKMLSVESVADLKEKRRASLSENKTESESAELERSLNDAVRAHVCGWTNLYDLSTGEPFEFEPDESSTAETPPAAAQRFDALPVGLKSHLLRTLYELAGLA